MDEQTAGERPTVSVIIVSYNTRDLTVACIKSLQAHAQSLVLQIIVVDNASPDGSADAIESCFPSVTMIRSKENLGFARANNLAAERATGEYILLLNPDTLLLDDAVGNVVAFARREPNAGIWGGRTLYGDGSLNPTSCWGFITLRSMLFQMLGLSVLFAASEFFNAEPYGRWKRDRERRVDIVTGCFLLITRKLWDELGGFDPRYFMYAEEADLSFRAQKLGASPMITPTATIVHLESQSDPIRVEKTVKVLRGKATFVRLHWGPVRRPLGLFLLKLSPAVRSAVHAAAHRVLRRTSSLEKSRLWGEIFRRRAEWCGGYPPFVSPLRAEKGL
jgi:GT2 family glycosyltransferase